TRRSSDLADARPGRPRYPPGPASQPERSKRRPGDAHQGGGSRAKVLARLLKTSCPGCAPALPARGEAMSISDPTSSVTELSIADIQARFAQGLLTCTELTQRLLQRIERYDKRGPCLNALLSVSPHALETARHKDREYDSNPAAVGPLHG